MNHNNKDAISNDQKSLSIIRTFLRYAVSTITYYKLSTPPARRPRHHYHESSGVAKTNRNKSLSPKKRVLSRRPLDNENDDDELDFQLNNTTTNTSNNTTSSCTSGGKKRKSHHDIDALSQDQIDSYFTEKNFCGIPNLKYFDLIETSDDFMKSIKDENVFKITKWMEHKVSPLLKSDHLISMNFVILSTPFKKRNKNEEDQQQQQQQQQHHRRHRRHHQQQQQNQHETHMNARLDIYKFHVDKGSTTNQRVGKKTDTEKNTISDQIQQTLTTLVDFLQKNSISHDNETNSEEHRTQVSMNFVLEYRKTSDGNNNNCHTSRSPYNSIHEEILFMNNDKDPLKEVSNEIRSLNSSSQENIHLMERSQDGNDKNVIVEFEDEDDDVDVDNKAEPSSTNAFESDGICHLLAQPSQSVSEYDTTWTKDPTFRVLNHFHTDYTHRVTLCHKMLDIDNIVSMESIQTLFGQTTPSKMSTEKEPTQHHNKKINGDFDCNEKKGLSSIQSERRRRIHPPSLTPMRPARSSSPLQSLPTSSSFAKKREAGGNTCSYAQQTSSFVTPRKLSCGKRKSPFLSSEAPTIIERLSSCMNSNSPLYSSVTPPNNRRP